MLSHNHILYFSGNLSAYPVGKVRAIVPIPFLYALLSHYKLFVLIRKEWRELRGKETALGYETSGGCAMQGLVTLLELVVVPSFRPVWGISEKPGGGVQPDLPEPAGKVWLWWVQGQREQSLL